MVSLKKGRTMNKLLIICMVCVILGVSGLHAQDYHDEVLGKGKDNPNFMRFGGK